MWLEEILSGNEVVGLPWLTILGFLRISTHRRIFPNPYSPLESLTIIEKWLACASVKILEPGPQHWRILRSVIAELGTAGNLTSDAHLAAMALEYDAELYSNDRDFTRIAKLRWVNPLNP